MANPSTAAIASKRVIPAPMRSHISCSSCVVSTAIKKEGGCEAHAYEKQLGLIDVACLAVHLRAKKKGRLIIAVLRGTIIYTDPFFQ